jgi:hypothetical protein
MVLHAALFAWVSTRQCQSGSVLAWVCTAIVGEYFVARVCTASPGVYMRTLHGCVVSLTLDAVGLLGGANFVQFLSRLLHFERQTARMACGVAHFKRAWDEQVCQHDAVPVRVNL